MFDLDLIDLLFAAAVMEVATTPTPTPESRPKPYKFPRVKEPPTYDWCCGMLKLKRVTPYCQTLTELREHATLWEIEVDGVSYFRGNP